MARPKDEPILRLSRRIWIRALRRGIIERAAKQRIESAAKQETLDNISWAELGRQLLRFSEYPQFADFHFKGLYGVVNDGNDPHLIVRRIDMLEISGTISVGLKVETRLTSSPKAVDAGKAVRYIQFPVDLVECGEELLPKSGYWETAYLWRLAMPHLPRLEELRMLISRLTTRLGMCSPSVDEYQPYLSTEQFSELEYLSEAQKESRYRQSLEPLIAAKSADAMSLLAALVAESFVTDQELMMYIHRDAFRQASERLLSDEHFKDLQYDFHNLVTARILEMKWQMPAAYHISSISSPYITMDSWKKITGHYNWTPIWDP